MSKIIVTGGCGFIGSNFIRYWLNKNTDDKILNLDKLTYAGSLTNLIDVEKQFPNNYEFVRGDIGNKELFDYLCNTFEPDYIVNFAAESHNSFSFINPNAFFETNTLGVLNMLSVLKDHEIKKFHHISTCEVYGDLPLDSDDSFTETSRYNPKTPYNASKASGDHVVRSFHESFEIPTTITNCANNYGPFQFPEKVIPLFVSNIIEGKQVPVYESSQNKREWIHVLDHASAIEMVLKKGKIGETYNVGTGIEKSVDQLVEIIFDELAEYKPEKKIVPDRPQHDTRYLLDSSKIKNELGWKPKYKFDNSIRETIRWYIDHQDWWQPLKDRTPVNEESWKK